MATAADQRNVQEPTEGGLRRAYGSGDHVEPLVDPDDGRNDPPVRRVARKMLSSMPILKWIRTYGNADLMGDLLSGSTVAVVLLPQAVAYALLVEIPPVNGLYTSFMPLIVFAIFTNSRHVCIGPFALVSLVVASVVSDILPADRTDEEYLNGVLLLSMFTGLVQIVMGAFGLGMISSFLADSSISGFTTAVAMIIISSQLKYVLGVHIPRSNLPVTLYLAAEIIVTHRTNWWEVLITVTALFQIIGMKTVGKKYIPKIPLFEQLIAVIIFTAVAYATEIPVAVIGDLPAGLPVPSFPTFPNSLDLLGNYLSGASVTAFTSFLVSMSIVRIFAAKHNDPYDANQELLALGMANIIGGIFQAYPSSGSFSRTAIVSSLGGKTPMHGIVQAASIALVLLVLTPLFKTLPYAVLAAIIFAALQSLVEFSSAKKLWNSSRPDFALWVIAFLSTALFGVTTGLLVSLAASLGLLVLRTSRPRWVVLGRLPGTDIFRDLTRYPAAQSIPRVLIFRWDAPLHFANAEYFAQTLQNRLHIMAKIGNEATHVVLDCSSIHTIDSSAHTVFSQLVQRLHGNDVAFLVANTRAPFRAALHAHGTYDSLIGENNMFLSIHDAVEQGCALPRQAPASRNNHVEGELELREENRPNSAAPILRGTATVEVTMSTRMQPPTSEIPALVIEPRANRRNFRSGE